MKLVDLLTRRHEPTVRRFQTGSAQPYTWQVMTLPQVSNLSGVTPATISRLHKGPDIVYAVPIAGYGASVPHSPERMGGYGESAPHSPERMGGYGDTAAWEGGEGTSRDGQYGHVASWVTATDQHRMNQLLSDYPGNFWPAVQNIQHMRRAAAPAFDAGFGEEGGWPAEDGYDIYAQDVGVVVNAVLKSILEGLGLTGEQLHQDVEVLYGGQMLIGPLHLILRRLVTDGLNQFIQEQYGEGINTIQALSAALRAEKAEYAMSVKLPDQDLNLRQQELISRLSAATGNLMGMLRQLLERLEIRMPEVERTMGGGWHPPHQK